MTWTVDLPWPAPLIRDNGRYHWARKADLTRTLRYTAHALAANAKLPQYLERVRVELHWQPATRRRRDQLSIAPTLKPLVDGLVDYGLIPDDDVDHCELGCVIRAAETPARLWLEITDLSEENA